ncbi:MAG TPA: TetR/AcrR family transcriptional regulator [Actinomadura sp.]|nr:TetR/AcrR family transcriptional regulator [Actinomadura sp.]
MVENGTAARIASAARAILVSEGAGAVSMRRVAAAVGITPMAIYTHYPSRDALLRAVADAAFAELAGKWAKGPVSGDWEAGVFGLLEDFLDFALGDPHLYTFLFTEMWEQGRRFPEDFRDGGSPTFGQVVEAVERGMLQGLLKRDDALEVALSLTGHTQRLVQLYLGGRIDLPERDFRALCARATGRILNGLKA